MFTSYTMSRTMDITYVEYIPHLASGNAKLESILSESVFI